MAATDCIDEYFALMESKPRLFESSEVYPIVTDRAEIEKFEKESGKKIGVLYKSRFNTLVVDLIRGKNGYFSYERVIPTASGRGVVCVPVVEGKFLLMSQYRHPVRDTQLCFPRGFGEDGIASEDNAKKELFEETGLAAESCEFLGSLTADSGLIGSECDVYLCHAGGTFSLSAEEGVKELFLLDGKELEEKIAQREITDGFTLSAYMLFKTKR